MAFAFYVDASLTQQVTGNYQVNSGTNDYRFFLGSTSSATKLQDATSPGVTNISITVGDVNAGSGPETTWIKLALTQSGLDTATPGAALSVGSTILGGTANALPFWVRIANSLSGAVSSTDLSLSVSNIKEFAI